MKIALSSVRANIILSIATGPYIIRCTHYMLSHDLILLLNLWPSDADSECVSYVAKHLKYTVTPSNSQFFVITCGWQLQIPLLPQPPRSASIYKHILDETSPQDKVQRKQSIISNGAVLTAMIMRHHYTIIPSSAVLQTTQIRMSWQVKHATTTCVFACSTLQRFRLAVRYALALQTDTPHLF